MVDTLPEGSRLGCPPGQWEPWTTAHEQAAQVIEEVSVVASAKQRKEPVEAHRPEWVKRLRKGQSVDGSTLVTDPGTVTGDTQGVIRGHLAVAAKFAGQGRSKVTA